jgi:membrane protein DedA with SNARE-associated domain
MLDTNSIVNFVRDWGYLAVCLGAIVEGEVVLLTASAFAAGGYLSIYKVFWIAFITTVVVDQVLFLIGYRSGTEFLAQKMPKFRSARDRVFSLLKRMDVFFIIAFRFIYGIRTISPIIIGSAKINPSKFVGYNVLSGFCWAFVSCFIGYAVADVVTDGTFDLMPTILVVSVLITLLGIGIFMIMKFRDKHHND